MKKLVIVMLLVISMVTMLGFAPAEATYWEDMKAIYEWEGIEGEAEMAFTVVVPPDVNLQYDLKLNSESNLEDFVSYMEITIEDKAEFQEFPTIKLYTEGTDFYINTEAVLPIISMMGLDIPLEIEEEYILFKTTETPVDMNSKVLQDILVFIEEMDLGIDLDMTKEGNTYTLNLNSDEIIDLLDAYMLYIFTNMDKLPQDLMPAEMPEITEEHLEEILEMYNSFIKPNIPMAKAFIEGSYYKQLSTFDEDAITEETDLALTTPMAQVHIEGISVSKKLDSVDIQLPTSVKVVTDKDLEEFFMGMFMPDTDTQSKFKAIIDLEGAYKKPVGDTAEFEEGVLRLMVEDNRSYITVEDVSILLDIEIEGDGFIAVRDLEQYGFQIIWNPYIDMIEIY